MSNIIIQSYLKYNKNFIDTCLLIELVRFDTDWIVKLNDFVRDVSVLILSYKD